MTSRPERPAAGARARRAVLVLVGVVVVLGPIPVGLAWAWSVHPLLVVPAYLLGIAAWLTLLSGAWALVRRLRPARDEPAGPGATDESGAATALPPVRSDLRLPSPRGGARAPRKVSSPTP